VKVPPVMAAEVNRRWLMAAGLCLAATASPLLPAQAAPAPRQIIKLLHRARHGWPVDLSGAALGGFDLTGVDFKSATLAEADLFGVNLTDAALAGCDMRRAHLDRAIVTRAEFSSSNLEAASLMSLTMFTTLERHHSEAARFAGARMARAQLSGYLDYCDFRWADLSAAVFGSGGGAVSLIGAKFGESNLTGTHFNAAALTFCRFNGADLSGADLSGCELSQADFSGATVTGMNVAGANLNEAIFTGARGFESVKGLDLARNAQRLKGG